MIALLILSLTAPAHAEVVPAPSYTCSFAAVVSGQLPKVYSGDLRLIGSGTVQCKGKGAGDVTESVSVRVHGGSSGYNFGNVKSISISSSTVEGVSNPRDLMGIFQLGAGLHATHMQWGQAGAAMDLSVSGENAAGDSEALTGGSLMVEPQ